MIGALSSEKKMSCVSEKRHSVNPKTSEAHGAPPASAITASPNSTKLSLAGRLSHQLTPPRLDVSKRQNVFSPFGQLFLCIIGTLLSISVSVWLAFFSSDLRWRRAVFATAAALCSLMFMLLAFATYRRNSRHPPPHLVEIGPSILRHRRSTAGGVSARRSTKTEEECILPSSKNGGGSLDQLHGHRPPIIMQHSSPNTAHTLLTAHSQVKKASVA